MENAEPAVRNNSDAKLNAAADFTKRLLSGPLGSAIARVVLFGSVSQGDARPDSDIDILVFGDAPPDALSESVSEAAWESIVASGELVTPLTYSLSDLFSPHSYLLYNALKRGQDLYAMDEQEIRRREVHNLQQKASSHLAQARRAAERGDFELAIVGAQAAADLAAKGLVLLKPDTELPSSHGGLIQIFSREYITSGEAPTEWGRLLSSALQLRSRALYDALATLRRDDTEVVLDLARALLAFLEKKVEDLAD